MTWEVPTAANYRYLITRDVIAMGAASIDGLAQQSAGERLA
jgi:hypothetical protein